MFNGIAYLRPRWPTLATHGLYFLPDREILNPNSTPREHFAMLRRQFHGPSDETVTEALALDAILDRRCATLSTGELRRAEVASALVRAPLCVLADEPLRHIDPRDRQLIADALKLLAAQGCAVVVTGHDVEDLFDIASQVVWRTDGTTYELGTPAQAVAKAT